MSLLKPKTIIITGQPACPLGAYVTSSPVLDLDALMDDRIDSDDESSVGGPRKRRRLTYLTPEEKMVRRKLKNRVAAQTARDRKKQRMTELEEMIQVLQARNQHLSSENEELRRTTQSLIEANAQLRQRLEIPDTNTMTLKSEAVTTDSEVATRKLSETVTESAVLDIPQQQETARTSIQLAAYYLAWLTLLLMIRCLDSSKMKSKTISSETSSIRRMPMSCQFMDKHKTRPPLEWWGRHQQNWNPPMN